MARTARRLVPQAHFRRLARIRANLAVLTTCIQMRRPLLAMRAAQAPSRREAKAARSARPALSALQAMPVMALRPCSNVVLMTTMRRQDPVRAILVRLAVLPRVAPRRHVSHARFALQHMNARAAATSYRAQQVITQAHEAGRHARRAVQTTNIVLARRQVARPVPQVHTQRVGTNRRATRAASAAKATAAQEAAARFRAQKRITKTMQVMPRARNARLASTSPFRARTSATRVIFTV